MRSVMGHDSGKSGEESSRRKEGMEDSSKLSGEGVGEKETVMSWAKLECDGVDVSKRQVQIRTGMDEGKKRGLGHLRRGWCEEDKKELGQMQRREDSVNLGQSGLAKLVQGGLGEMGSDALSAKR
ncbi:hypothetical protein O6H91_02G023000 [Diphasiastrum complanatum]|uniref:Uncharacterized protein n=1 Tax=Diphasiastrum complanatum TaxID=34168 RepID=A0ACC2EDX5_DIPCM|nr:hypothetical protein O6H91_02G023000 [Diphasiastrum complanatum]